MEEKIKKIEEELAEMEKEWLDGAEKLIIAFPSVISFCSQAASIQDAGVDIAAMDTLKEDMLAKADKCRTGYNFLSPYIKDKKEANKLNAKIEKLEKELRSV